MAFSGDVTGVRIRDGCILAPTPPPDIDLQAWRASLDVRETWRPRGLTVTHFGAHQDVENHLAALREQLASVPAMAHDLDAAGFVSAIRATVAHSTTKSQLQRTSRPFLQNRAFTVSCATVACPRPKGGQL